MFKDSCYMCMYVHVCACVCAHVYAHIWMSEHTIPLFTPLTFFFLKLYSRTSYEIKWGQIKKIRDQKLQKPILGLVLFLIQWDPKIVTKLKLAYINICGWAFPRLKSIFIIVEIYQVWCLTSVILAFRVQRQGDFDKSGPARESYLGPLE